MLKKQISRHLWTSLDESHWIAKEFGQSITKWRQSLEKSVFQTGMLCRTMATSVTHSKHTRDYLDISSTKFHPTFLDNFLVFPWNQNIAFEKTGWLIREFLETWDFTKTGCDGSGSRGLDQTTAQGELDSTLKSVFTVVVRSSLLWRGTVDNI